VARKRRESFGEKCHAGGSGRGFQDSRAPGKKKQALGKPGQPLKGDSDIAAIRRSQTRKQSCKNANKFPRKERKRLHRKTLKEESQTDEKTVGGLCEQSFWKKT